MQMCIVLRCIAAHNWQRPSISQLKVSTIQTKDLKDSFFFSFTEKIALKTTMLRSQFRKVCKIIIQGLGYLVPPSEGGVGKQFVLLLLLFLKHKYSSCSYWQKLTFKKIPNTITLISSIKLKSRNQEHNLLYLICLHDTEFAISKNPTIH